ncbi:MAG: hypothetical protein CMM29_07540 [Rhodospirillaceae bacterium]|nr:hypothetical protein [Rhodospirillaceae bacterium]
MIILKQLNVLTLTSLIIFIIGCQSPVNQVLPDLTFRHLSAIPLKVSKIKIIYKDDNSISESRVDQRMKTPPRKILEQWAKDRLQIGGISNTATFVILDASITETKLAKNNTLFDFIKLQASERYHLKIKAQIIIKNDNGQTLASSTSSASWSQTVREDTSYVERQKIWFNMVEKSMKKFDEKMNEAVTAYLGDYTL